MLNAPAIQVESTYAEDGNDLHIFPQESRRGKAQWDVYVRLDGSASILVAGEEILLPKNSKTPNVHSKPRYYLKRNEEGQLEFLEIDPLKGICTDVACPLISMTQHQFGSGCRLWDEKSVDKSSERDYDNVKKAVAVLDSVPKSGREFTDKQCAAIRTIASYVLRENKILELQSNA